MTRLLFLRSPPFPKVAPGVAAISMSLDDPAQAGFVSDAVLDAVARDRVGGVFWGHAISGIKLVVRQGISLPANIAERFAGHEIGVVGADNPSARGDAMVGRLLPDPCDLWALMQDAQCVHAALDDELAIIAGLSGVPVFGPDHQPIAPAELRAAARQAIATARYRDCFADGAATVEEAVAQLAQWRRHLDGNRHIAAASGMAFWKRDAISRFLWDGVGSPPFLPVRQGIAKAARDKASLAVWPSRVPPTAGADAAQQGVSLARIEDGFLRSRGLGAALNPPGSIVIDRRGIYYDAHGPSDLEHLLATHDFPPALVARAQRLRERICASGVTKYNLDAGRMIALPDGRRTVLAVGQVEDDMSVQLGGAGIKSNLDFLTRVRRAEPDAWIIYRPHPDVQAGHRKGHLSNAAVLAQADCIDTGSPLMDLVQGVDETHVLSSLTGFEALMRGRPVTVHGMPFYAGWGLTRDLAAPTGRRERRLTLDQLVAAVLILYSRYLDPATGLPCGPEIMVDRMASGATPPVTMLVRWRMLQGKLRRLITLSTEFLHG
ncbi:beta-3-deoxy-D-manno-oct-2-ulosonic acid transferase [Sphingobium sp.]|uniref:capsular polysaccharide export protein, LipB/KpsS family n=1 Tax=Sphingobium sp. TaxID=1912891 RepID=UPI003BB5DD1F